MTIADHPASEASLPRRVRGFEKNRLEALADGIFAVALTLLVLGIKLPEQTFASNDELWRRLLELKRHFAIYVISFVVIGMYWISHHIQFHFVRFTDRRIIWMNMFYLLLTMLVAFVSTHASIYTYLLLLLAHFFTGPVDEHIHTTPVDDAGASE